MNTDRTQLSESELQLGQPAHALAVLLGGKGMRQDVPLPPAPVAPASLPSTLLDQRPEIAAVERLVAAANARIGLARTAFYPVLDPGASAGFLSGSPGQWLDAPSRICSLAPSLAATLFDGGARSAGLEQARAGYDRAVASYRQTVVIAFQEVQDKLAAARLLQREAEEQALAPAAACRAREIAGRSTRQAPSAPSTCSVRGQRSSPPNAAPSSCAAASSQPA